MKSDIDASVTFAREIAKAGTDALAVMGEEVEKVGDDVETDETPLQLASAAVLGIQRAHATFVTGAVAAAQRALGTRRAKNAGPTPRALGVAGGGPGLPGSSQPSGSGGSTKDFMPGVIFAASETDTVTLSGLVDYSKLRTKMNEKESGYIPAKLKSGKGEFGLLHIYFDSVGKTRFGSYAEILVLATAVPKDDPGETVQLPDKMDAMPPFAILTPMSYPQAVNFAFPVLIDAQSPEVIPFGREILGLDKQPVHARRFAVHPDFFGVIIEDGGGAPLLDYALKFDEGTKVPVPGVGKVLRYSVVTKAPGQTAYRRWTWTFEYGRAPVTNPIDAKVAFKFSPHHDVGRLLRDLGFKPSVSTWTFGLDGAVEGLDILPRP
jgi:hypothetical protein